MQPSLVGPPLCETQCNSVTRVVQHTLDSVGQSDYSIQKHCNYLVLNGRDTLISSKSLQLISSPQLLTFSEESMNKFCILICNCWETLDETKKSATLFCGISVIIVLFGCGYFSWLYLLL